MICKECSGNSFDFDERLGERVCNICGLVDTEEIFEITESQIADSFDNFGNSINDIKVGDSFYGLGSKIGQGKDKTSRKLRRTEMISTPNKERTLKKGVRFCILVSSEYIQKNSSITDQLVNNYKILLENGTLVGSSYEERAGAIVFFTLKENGFSVTIKDIARKSGADKTRIHKLARKVARVFCRPWVLSQTNYQADLEKICLDANLDRKFIVDCNNVLVTAIPIAEYEGLALGRGFLCGIVYITARLNKTKITTIKLAELNQITDVSIRNNVNKLLEPLRITKEELNNITVEEFVSGAICGKF